MEILLIFFFALLGLAIGSFLNVCIDRLPRNESIVNPPSHCDVCQHKLAAKDNIPVFSYLRLRGHCRYCQASIPRRIFWVELATALIFALLCWHYQLSPELGIMIFYACLFIIIFVIDLEQGLILNKVVYPGMVVALLLSLLPQSWLTQPSWLTIMIKPGIASAALGGGIGFALFLLIAVVSRGGMGWGDVKLAALIGLATGFPLVFLAIIMGAILGGIVAVALMIARRRNFKGTIPFGPFLALAAMVTLLWGSNILNWYVALWR
ncbi:MAG TPA: prepilin peptidase [Dehalococcoidia bacterium]|nr:prepilin peptidase [Dehalococcoidia bacterium]